MADTFGRIPRSSEGGPNWAADTDPLTPEPVLVDPNGLQASPMLAFADPAPAMEAAPARPPIQPPAPAPASPAPSVDDMRDVLLGTLVFRAGLVAQEQVEEALQYGMKTGRRLGDLLLERAWISESDLGRLLAAQNGLQFFELDLAMVDPAAPPLLPEQKARLHGALPIGFHGGLPVVAVADPSNDLVAEAVRRALNCEPHFVVVGRDALQRAIDEVYRPVVLPETSPFEPLAVESQPVESPLQTPADEAPVEPEAAHDPAEPELADGWSVVLRLANGERLEVAAYATETEAKAHASSVVFHLANDRAWPNFGDRFIRPAAIISVDLLENEKRGAGSSPRPSFL